VYVYALMDHLGVVRYVGQTTQPAMRLTSHINNHDGLNAGWISAIRSEGKRPHMHILATVDRASVSTVEKEYIRRYLAEGASLTNKQYVPVEGPERKPHGFAVRASLVRRMRRVAAQEDRKMYEVMEETMEDYIAEWMAMHGQPHI